jgi:hypothetical protein
MSDMDRAVDKALDELLAFALVLLAIIIVWWLFVGWQIWLAVEAHIRYQNMLTEAGRDFDVIGAEVGIDYPPDDVLQSLLHGYAAS